jgi:hypothetical protein
VKRRGDIIHVLRAVLETDKGDYTTSNISYAALSYCWGIELLLIF